MVPSRTLGGWARLALALSVLWTLTVAGLTVMGMPTRQVLERATVPIVYDPATKEFLTVGEAERRQQDRRSIPAPGVPAL